MFKLLVLSALLAAAAAKPDVLLPTALGPATYAATIGAPLVAPSILASPAVYSDLAFSHLIKKRAAQFPGTYLDAATYIAGTPWDASYASPITYASSVLPAYAPAHFIKKRSAQLLDVAPALPFVAPAPLASTYSSAIIPSVYSAYPGYGAVLPFIKK